MHEYRTPLEVPVPSSGNLTDDVVRNAAEHGDAVVFSVRAADARREVSARTFLEQVRSTARGLVAAGIEPGERVALMSKTRYEWTVLDYAIWYAGCVSVPIYETSSAEQVHWILTDSGARAVVAETPEHISRIKQVRDDLDGLHHVWSIEGGALDVLRTLGEDICPELLEQRRTAPGPDDLATLIYTSGTTGQPKGCMLTHANLMFEVSVAVTELDQLFTDEATTLLFLPLAHVFARVIQVGCVRARVRLAHSSDMRTLADDLLDVRPTFVLAVPRVFEKIFNTASQRAVADGRGALFARAAEAAIAWSRAQEAGRPGLLVRAGHRLFERPVYTRLRDALGGGCRYAVSGGAPLGERLAHFYRGIGVTVLEGYGLTETTAAVTVNLPQAHKVGTVGRPLPGTAVRVADESELELHGGQVFAGYWHDEDSTSAAFTTDGWFRTGDLGEIDEEGFVRITGRKKEILVTAGGKNVAPAVLEDRIRAHALVDQCLVVGDGRPFVAALVTLDQDAVRDWLARRGAAGTDANQVADPDLRPHLHRELREEIQAAVEEANRAVSRAESVRTFALVAGRWTEEDGQLTPSLKLRRNVVLREQADAIEALYRR